MEARDLCMVGKCSATQLQPQTIFVLRHSVVQGDLKFMIFRLSTLKSKGGHYHTWPHFLNNWHDPPTHHLPHISGPKEQRKVFYFSGDLQ